MQRLIGAIVILPLAQLDCHQQSERRERELNHLLANSHLIAQHVWSLKNLTIKLLILSLPAFLPSLIASLSLLFFGLATCSSIKVFI